MNKKTVWGLLPMKERSELMRAYIDAGEKDLSRMKEHYNRFDRGGKTYTPQQLLELRKTDPEAYNAYMQQQRTSMTNTQTPTYAADATRVQQATIRPIEPATHTLYREMSSPPAPQPQLSQGTPPSYAQRQRDEGIRQQQQVYDNLDKSRHIWGMDPTLYNNDVRSVADVERANRVAMGTAIATEAAMQGVMAGAGAVSRGVRNVASKVKVKKTPLSEAEKMKLLRFDDTPMTVKTYESASQVPTQPNIMNTPVEARPTVYDDYNKLSVRSPIRYEEARVVDNYTSTSRYINPFVSKDGVSVVPNPLYDKKQADIIENLVVGTKGGSGHLQRRTGLGASAQGHLNYAEEVARLDEAFSTGTAFYPQRNMEWSLGEQGEWANQFGNSRVNVLFDENVSRFPTNFYSGPMYEREILLGRKLGYGVKSKTPNELGGYDYWLEILNPYKFGGKLNNRRV